MKDQPSDPTKVIPQKPDIQFAVFNGSEEITPKMYEEVERFAAFVAGCEKTQIVSE